MEISSLIGISLAIIALGYIAYSFVLFAQDYGMTFVRALPFIFPTIVILLFVGVLVFRAGEGIEQHIQQNATQTEQVAQVEAPVQQKSEAVQPNKEKTNPINLLIYGWCGLLCSLFLLFTLVWDSEDARRVIILLYVATLILFSGAMLLAGVGGVAKRINGADSQKTQQESVLFSVPQENQVNWL